MLSGWRYYWRRYFEWFPIQPCHTCGRLFFAGWPVWSPIIWEWVDWPGWCEFCSRECCDEDMEFTEALSDLGVFKPMEDEPDE